MLKSYMAIGISTYSAKLVYLGHCHLGHHTHQARPNSCVLAATLLVHSDKPNISGPTRSNICISDHCSFQALLLLLFFFFWHKLMHSVRPSHLINSVQRMCLDCRTPTTPSYTCTLAVILKLLGRAHASWPPHLDNSVQTPTIWPIRLSSFI